MRDLLLLQGEGKDEEVSPPLQIVPLWIIIWTQSFLLLSFFIGSNARTCSSSDGTCVLVSLLPNLLIPSKSSVLHLPHRSRSSSKSTTVGRRVRANTSVISCRRKRKYYACSWNINSTVILLLLTHQPTTRSVASSSGDWPYYWIKLSGCISMAPLSLATGVKKGTKHRPTLISDTTREGMGWEMDSLRHFYALSHVVFLSSRIFPGLIVTLIERKMSLRGSGGVD